MFRFIIERNAIFPTFIHDSIETQSNVVMCKIVEMVQFPNFIFCITYQHFIKWFQCFEIEIFFKFNRFEHAMFFTWRNDFPFIFLTYKNTIRCDTVTFIIDTFIYTCINISDNDDWICFTNRFDNVTNWEWFLFFCTNLGLIKITLNITLK